MTITIANVRDLPPPAEWPEWQVYVGRRVNRHKLQASPLENRWGLHWDTRDRAIEKYRLDLAGALGVNGDKHPNWSGPIRAELRRLRALLTKHDRLTLVCWCAPKPCHAEIIRDALAGHAPAADKEHGNG